MRASRPPTTRLWAPWSRSRDHHLPARPSGLGQQWVGPGSTYHHDTIGRDLCGRELPLLQMVPDLPEVVEAQPVGQLDLLQRVGQQPLLVVWRPGAGELVLVEDPESHGGP